MHSRLYEQLLNNHPRLQHTAAFNSLYDNSGIVGVFTTTDADYAEEAINLVAKELQVCTDPQMDLLRSPRERDALVATRSMPTVVP